MSSFASGPPPPAPSFIYRGHHAPVHALEFFAGNRLLLSGDEQGWLFVWDLWTRRAVLKWRAHGATNQRDDQPSAVLAVRVLPLNPHCRPSLSPSSSAAEESRDASTGTTDRRPQKQQQKYGPTQCLILSHGRDHRIHVWDICDKLAEVMCLRTRRRSRRRRQQRSTVEDEGDTSALSFAPVPVFTLPVSALNFCKMDVMGVPSAETSTDEEEMGGEKEEKEEETLWSRRTGYRQILVAVPSTLEANKMDVYDLLKPEAVFQGIEAPSPSTSSVGSLMGQAGMAKGHGAVMAIRLVQPEKESLSSTTRQDMVKLRLLVGYEDGSVCLFKEMDIHTSGTQRRKMSHVWTFKGHREPVLSIAVSDDQKFAISCASDNNLIRYMLGNDTQGVPETVKQSLKANGIAEVQIRDDLKIVVLAGWDGKIRIFSFKTLKPLAILTCHRESLYCVALASVEGVLQDLEYVWIPSIKDTSNDEGNNHNDNDTNSDSDSSDSDDSEEDVEDQKRRLQEFSRQHWLAAGGKENRISQWQIY